jgi:hypothetical protein
MFLINCTIGVHLKHSDKDDNCPCGMDEKNKMALVFFDRFVKGNNGEEVPERYLVSEKILGSGGFSKVNHCW